MNFGDRLLQAAQKRRENKRRKLKGPLGDYYRSGGNILLYDLPITSEGIVIDAGGFNGDWTRNIILMYGCRSEIFEPFPEYAVKLENFFRRNPHVNVHKVGLGGAGRLTNMAFQDDATSEFIPGTNMKGQDTQVEIVDVADYLAKLQDAEIDCIKLNIEGAEYEVLERILEDKQIVRFKSILVQFHRQPDDYAQRMSAIVDQLHRTHDREWHFPMVWEKWLIKV